MRLMLECRGDHPSKWAAMKSVAAKLGMTPEAVRQWVRQAERDTGHRPGATSSEAEELRRLRAENRERRRANEILKAAAGFFLVELDRHIGPREVHRRPADKRTVDGLRWGVEPICRVLGEQGTPIAAALTTTPSPVIAVRCRWLRLVTSSSASTSRGCMARTTACTALGRSGWH